MEQDTTCPYCNERPMVKRKNAATCGDKACQKARNRERMDTDEWRERMRENMRAKRAAGMETETMEDRTCEACGCTYRVEARRPQRYCSRKCNASQQDMKELSRLAAEAMSQLSNKPRAPRACVRCGSQFDPPNATRATCSEKCRQIPRSPLRAAWDAGHLPNWEAALKDRCDVTPEGCWEWQGRLKGGYAVINFGSRSVQVHRASLEMRLGRGLGSEAAHHMCANTKCVNPQHLQPISDRENVAEMHERSYYRNRIAELENALRSVAPNHEALTENLARTVV